MQTNLPPLEIHSGLFPDDCSLRGRYGELSVDQAALVIDIVEVRYPKALEVLKNVRVVSVACADHFASRGKNGMTNNDLIKLTYDNVQAIESCLASLESK